MKKNTRKSTAIEKTKNVERIKDFFWRVDEIQNLLSSAQQFKYKCEYEGRNWESIRMKCEQIQEIIVVPYSQTDEESKDFPNLKKCNCIVFLTVNVFSLIKKLILY